MKGHLLAIESGGKTGRRLSTPELGDVVKSIKALSGRAKAVPRPSLGGKSINEIMREAADKHPTLAAAMAALGNR